LGVAGLGLSLFGHHVAFEMDKDPDYVALCDISESVSCTKVFQSEQGKLFSHLGLIEKDSLFDFHNSAWAILFFSV
ncbi:unnamed protein product, partial [Chrysoparadoxa australica]